MRAIALTAKWQVSALAIVGLLAGCAEPMDVHNWDIVAVKSRPEASYDTLENTYGCLASVIHNIPATRYFANGRQEEYLIRGVVGTKDICK